MSKMTPREALYHVCLKLGPRPMTKRDDNIHPSEARLRDAIKTLQNFIEYRQPGDSYEEFELEDYHREGDQIEMDLGDKG